MKKSLITTIALIALLNGYAQNSIIHDPNAQVHPVKNFSAISVSGDIDLYLSQGNEDAVAVSASETTHRDRIRTQVENNELKIWYDGKGLNFSSGNKKLKAYVSFKNISKLSASGASNVHVNGAIKGNELAIHLTGASDFKGAVDIDKLSLNQTGASDMTVSGKASNVHIEAVGASSVKGYTLETQNCTIKATGASDIKITVHKELTANATGASSISYKGNGVIREVHSSGASSVNKKS
jgi:hypothetical protein